MAEEAEYIMGVDEYGYDNNTSSVCVMKRNSIEPTGTLVAMYTTRNKTDFDVQFNWLKAFYNIPDKNILREE